MIPFDLIHIGKCAGSTITRELRAEIYDFEHFHMRRPMAQPERRYVILARGEEEFLFSFENANALAEQLDKVGPFDVIPAAVLMGLIGHVPQGFQWYLDHIEASQIAGVICIERLADDFEHLFGFRPAMELNRTDRKSSSSLSEKGRANLSQEFHLEYAVLQKLSAMANEAGVQMSMTYEAATDGVPNLQSSHGAD
jgi:hypothetical protein